MTDKKDSKIRENKNFDNNMKKRNNREFHKDYTQILNKILLSLYTIIVILVVNTTILLLKDVKWGTTNQDANTNIGGNTGSEQYDVSMFTSVTSDTLKEATAGDEAKIVYIGRATCGHCVNFLPVLQQAQKDYDYETLYLDITTITTTEQQDKILELDNEEGFLNENFQRTTKLLQMKNRKIINTLK